MLIPPAASYISGPLQPHLLYDFCLALPPATHCNGRIVTLLREELSSNTRVTSHDLLSSNYICKHTKTSLKKIIYEGPIALLLEVSWKFRR